MEVASLPPELWRLVLSYLALPDLGRCCVVSRAWYQLVLSLDSTRWRELCLARPECRHPNWPRRPHEAPSSWREALRQHVLASGTWTRNGSDLRSTACLHAPGRRKGRRVWHVGGGVALGLESLTGALGAARPYDKLLLHPGVYEEQVEVTLKVPLEIVGTGNLGDVSLMVRFDQQCPTARLCNLVFMPAWLSPVVYKTSSGHVQIDNCNFKGCQLYVRGPGTCQLRFCSFAQGGSAHFLGVALSLVDSCEFSGADLALVTVEGLPTSERNWACKHLLALTRTLSGAGTGEEACGPQGGEDWSKAEVDWQAGGSRTKAGDELKMEDGAETWSEEEEEEDCEEQTLSYQQHGLARLCEAADCPAFPPPRTLSAELQQDAEARELMAAVRGCVLRRCLLRDGKGGVHLCNQAHARLEQNLFRQLNYAVRCIQNARVVMLGNEVRECRASGVFLRLSAGGLIADNNIHSNGEAGLDVRKGADPLILCNRIHSGQRSGIVVLGNGKGSIRSNRIYGNREAGVYILFNGNPVVRGNHIYQGLAAGIAVNENGRGLITENVIRQNQWGGADIRRGADPILRTNFICHGFSDGVVVGEKGRGLIEGNHIYGNRGCGVWLMASSLPQLRGNHITHNRMYGLAVFCRKEAVSGEREETGGAENFHEDGEAAAWDSELESEDEQLFARQPITVALLEGNRVSNNGAAGLYVKSSEPLNVAGNALCGNSGAGVSVHQSAQLTRLLGNCVMDNAGVGVAVEHGCRAELRGNGVYGNGGHGVCFRGDGVIVENDVVGNRGVGLRVMDGADVKVLRNRLQGLRAPAVSVKQRVRGVVQDNLLYQARPTRTPVRTHPHDLQCVVLNNLLLTPRSQSVWALEDPPPRPHDPATDPAHLATNRITASVESGCHNNSSVFCAIL